jgi:hypothetical protein
MVALLAGAAPLAAQRRVYQRHQCFLSNGKPVISDETEPQVEAEWNEAVQRYMEG